LGQRVEVLVEGPSDRAKGRGEVEGDIVQLTGRTHDDRIVVFDGPLRLVGEIIPVAVYDVSPHTLFGAVVTQEAESTLLTVG